MVLDGGRLHESEQDLAVFGIQRCQIRKGAPQSTNEAHSGHGVAVQTVRMNRYCKMWDLAYMYVYTHTISHINLYSHISHTMYTYIYTTISHITIYSHISHIDKPSRKSLWTISQICIQPIRKPLYRHQDLFMHNGCVIGVPTFG